MRRSFLLLPLALAACGKRARLRPPPEEAGAFDWPRFYPAPKTVLPEGAKAEPPAAAEPEAPVRGPALEGPDDLLDPERDSVTVYGPVE